MTEKNSAALSVACGETVRGYEVKRLPLGEYLRAIEAVRCMPAKVLAACYPGEDAAAILARLKHIEQKGLAEMMERLLGVAPAQAVALLAVLTGVPEEALLNDPSIGLDGAAQMLEAFWRINGIENFMQAARRLAAAIRSARTAESAGCKG